MNATRSVCRKNRLIKAAGIVGDYAATLPTTIGSYLPVVGPAVRLAGFGGTIGGLAVDPGKTKNKDTDTLSFAPGVAQYRLMQRLRRVSDASDSAGKHGGANLVAEILGKYTTGAMTGAAGGYAGYKFGPAIAERIAKALGDKPLAQRTARIAGASAGATLGVAAPALVAALVAAVNRKRSKQEQINADTELRAAAKYFVPGLSTYDSFKRMGASTHYDEKQKKAAEDRSAVRRAALTKVGFIMPSAANNVYQLGGAGALALGSMLGGSAMTGDDQSTLKRIGKGALGTALAYGGYKAMTDPRWQKGIGNAVSKGGDIARGIAAYIAGIRPVVK